MISDIRRIQALHQLAERGTVTAAAAALGYTPSAVSQQLAALEAELGVPVIERRGRNVVLTDAGHVLLQHGRDALTALELAESTVAELQGEPVGPVRIGALASATASLITHALRTVMAEYPRLEPNVVVHPLDRNVEELRLGALDIAVDQSYKLSPHSMFDGLEVTELLTEPLLLLSPQDTPCETVDEAADLDWVCSPADSACGRSTAGIAARYGIAPRYRYETDDHFATVRLVGAGLAVAVLPALALLHPPDGVHTAVVPGAARTISAATRPSARSRPAVATVIEHLTIAAEAFRLDSLAA
ncbi:MAG: LysR family transcriptional regulator [Microthrixaceae bacterium]|nr:LysR family transcriptional regulator [Microthrixaceae bacterium]